MAYIFCNDHSICSRMWQGTALILYTFNLPSIKRISLVLFCNDIFYNISLILSPAVCCMYLFSWFHHITPWRRGAHEVVATFTGNARSTFSVIAGTIYRQIIIAQMKPMERRDELKYGLEWDLGVISKGQETVDREDQAKFVFLMKKKKESCARRGRGRGGGGEEEGERVHA